jgi:glycosyltransferase involved in cell wall biosynthesis
MSHVRQSSESDPFRVFCICGGFGVPFGTASTKRIKLIGKCLVSNGIPFHVWHIGPSSFEENKHKYGEVDGLTFEYLSPSVRWPSKVFVRIIYYLWGCIQLFFRLFQHRRNGVVYVYYQGDFINLWTLLLCRLMKIPAVQEVCEWWPGTADGTFFNEWMYENIMFRWSNGAIPISCEIQDRIRLLTGPDYPLCLLPVLVDPAENEWLAKKSLSDAPSRPMLVWCGMVDGYKRDVLFLIDAMAELKSHVGRNSLLRIVGPCTQENRAELLTYASSSNVSAERIDIVGFVSDAQLWNYCTQADALMMPLWNDDRSSTRFPTKLGQYVAAGRPIVTARIGETKHFLTDDTAMFYPPGDAPGLAQSLDRLLSDPALGVRLAARAKLEVLPKVDFRENAERISKWFNKIYSSSRHA